MCHGEFYLLVVLHLLQKEQNSLTWVFVWIIFCAREKEKVTHTTWNFDPLPQVIPVYKKTKFVNRIFYRVYLWWKLRMSAFPLKCVPQKKEGFFSILPKVPFFAYLERCHGCVQNSTRGRKPFWHYEHALLRQLVNQMLRVLNCAIIDTKTRFVNGILTIFMV